MTLSTRLTCLMAVLILAPAVTLAQNPNHDPGERGSDRRQGGDHEQHMESMAERLQLSDEQKEQWYALHEAHHPRMEEIRTEMQEQKEALREASRGEFDEAAAETAAERLGELTSEASLSRARLHAEVRALLTEEQQERFDRFHRQGHKNRHGGHRGEHHDGKDGMERGKQHREGNQRHHSEREGRESRER